MQIPLGTVSRNREVILKSELEPTGKSEGDSIEKPFAAKRINPERSFVAHSETVYYVGPGERHGASTVSPSLVRLQRSAHARRPARTLRLTPRK